MKKLKIFLLLLVVPAFLVTSCKKDEPEPEVTYQSPTFASQTVVDIPAGLTAKANGGDQNASIAVTYMGIANALSGFASYFTVPENAQVQNKKSTSKVYFWTYSGVSAWMTYTVLSDKYTWTYEYQTPDITRFTYISAEQYKTGKQGSWTIYYPEAASTTMWAYNWSINTSNAFIATLALNEGQDASSFNIASNADHSGSFLYKINNENEAEILWAANGSGTYWIRGYPNAVTGSWQ